MSHCIYKSKTWRMATLCTRAALPPRRVCITETPLCTHTHEELHKWQAAIRLQKASSPCWSFSLFLTIWVIYIGSIKHTVYVLLSRWLSISGFLYPFSTLHSLLMANYVKFCGLIMLNSENDDLKYGIIHFVFPVILYCRIRHIWIKHQKAILHLSILRLHSWEQTKQRLCEQSAARSLCWWAVSLSDGACGVGLTPDVPE